MHPILGSKFRFSLYLLGWIPLASALGFLLVRWGNETRLQGAVSAGILSVFYAFVCLSPWYLCQMFPLAPATIWKALLNHTAAAIFGAALLTGLAKPLGVPAPQMVILFASGILLYMLAASLHYAALSFQSSRQAENREQEARVLAREAELKALKMQINPHFLFNSLNSISALAVKDGQRAREMCIRLSDFLRSTLNLKDQETIPLSQELALVKAYLDVESIRFGHRLRFEQSVGPHCAGCPVPALILQPLVENAVKHGVAGMLEGGEVRIDTVHADGMLRIVVENDFDAEAESSTRNGIGLENVRRRLDVRYQHRARLSTNVAANRFTVELLMPCD
ncbi:MAG TPA: histidine kinase [Bryobacteraceae bacterium]|nr:histidine kinase [Bryobacteraceae bacterium]